jgi:hypothetical protein
VRAQKEQGREASIIESALQSTEETLANFGEMLRRVTELESWVCYNSPLVILPWAKIANPPIHLALPHYRNG